jgi:hypothetical protein
LALAAHSGEIEDQGMADANAITTRALNFGLESNEDPTRVAAELVKSAHHDRRLLRRAMGRIEHGCGRRHTVAEDRALLVLGLALAGGYNPRLGLLEVRDDRDGETRLTTAVKR